MDDKLHLDFETLSAENIKTAGHHRYSEHRTTDLMCAAFKFNDEPTYIRGFFHPTPKKYLSGDTVWPRVIKHVKAGGTVVSHNAAFENAIWNNVGVPRYGFPPMSYEQMDCTMARSLAMSLPAALDASRASVGLTVAKDNAGYRLMIKMSQPKTREFCPTCYGSGIMAGANPCRQCGGVGELYTWWSEPEEIEKLFAYCVTDVDVEDALDRRLSPLSPMEKAIWVLDQRINGRGIRADVPTVSKAMDIINSEETRLDDLIRDLTQQDVSSCNANVALKKWIISKGVETKGVAKDAILTLLARPDLPEDVRKVVEVRQEAAKSSTGKLAAILTGVSRDERLRGLHQYHGANTGRWAGRRFQPHNLPRPRKQTPPEVAAEILDVISSRSERDATAYIRLFHGRPMAAISDCLRGCLISAEDKDLVAADFSAVEARVCAWVAGEVSVLKDFENDVDPYLSAAAKTYHIKMHQVDDSQRQIGKVQVLALGFGGGVGALQSMCKGYGLTLAPAFDGLWKIADIKRRDQALKRFASEWAKAKKEAERKLEPFIFLDEKEWLASELIKLAWRETRPNIVEYWRLIDQAAIDAVQFPGTIFTVGEGSDKTLPEVRYVMKGSFLLCILPSGRKICYPYPEVHSRKTPWDTTKPTLTYKTEINRRWMRCPTYGGSLTENVVQAIARDLLAAAMLRVEAAGYRTVMHVHDELVTEVPKNFGSAEELEEIASELPTWAKGLPMQSKGWRDIRYKK